MHLKRVLWSIICILYMKFGAYNAQESRQLISEDTSGPFVKFIKSLSRLESALFNLEDEWWNQSSSTVSHLTESLAENNGRNHQVSENEIENLFALVRSLQRITDSLTSVSQTNTRQEEDGPIEVADIGPQSDGDIDTASRDTSLLQASEEDTENVSEDNRLRQNNIDSVEFALTASTTTFAPQLNLQTLLLELRRITDTYLMHSNGNDFPTPPAIARDPLISLAMLLQDLARAHASNIDHSLPRSENTKYLGSEEIAEGLFLIGDTLRQLAESSPVEDEPVTSPSPSTWNSVSEASSVNVTTVTESPTYKPCESPFREIAYKMCILSVEDRRLSWTKAEAYCQSQGSALAQEASVIKVKRVLNELYGEDGSRVRWPFWVGARMVDEGEEKSWQWYDGTGILSFLWSQGQPRPYTPEQTPEGACMILDGYQAYYTASLPCHLKRRFVCQRN